MKYLVTTPFFNIDSRGNAKPVAKGTVLTKKQYGALTPQKQLKCEGIAPTYGEAWLREEDALVGHYYYEMIDPANGANSVHLTDVLEGILTNRTRESLEMKIAQIKKVDSLYRRYRSGGSVEGLSGTAQMREVMAEIDPDRFG